MALGFQGLQCLPDAGVGGVFKFADGNVAAAVDPDSLVGFVGGHTEFYEGLVQRRTYEHPHLLPGGNGQPEMPEGQGGAVDDALAGIGERTVQIKENRLFHHRLPPLFSIM